MKNFIIFVSRPITLDSEFLEIERRGDRKEMCAYRNAIIKERLRRKAGLAASERLNDDRLFEAEHESEETSKTLPFKLTRWLYLAIALLWLAFVGQNISVLIAAAKSGDIVIACLLGFLSLLFLVFALGDYAKFNNEEYTKYSQVLATFLYLKDVFAHQQNDKEATDEVVKPAEELSEVAMPKEESDGSHLKPAAAPTDDTESLIRNFTKTIRYDSDTTLSIKQNRLDAILF